MLQELKELRDGALRDVADAETEEKLEELRVRHLGRKSQLRSIMRAIGSAAPEERPALGQAASIQANQPTFPIAKENFDVTRKSLGKSRGIAVDRKVLHCGVRI